MFLRRSVAEKALRPSGALVFRVTLRGYKHSAPLELKRLAASQRGVIWGLVATESCSLSAISSCK
jgi:hypothetical protein